MKPLKSKHLDYFDTRCLHFFGYLKFHSTHGSFRLCWFYSYNIWITDIANDHVIADNVFTGNVADIWFCFIYSYFFSGIVDIYIVTCISWMFHAFCFTFFRFDGVKRDFTENCSGKRITVTENESITLFIFGSDVISLCADDVIASCWQRPLTKIPVHHWWTKQRWVLYFVLGNILSISSFKCVFASRS